MYGSFVVAASTSSDALASFSNYGSAVDLVAPGAYIRMADTTGSYRVASPGGTSFAAPFVTGTVALLYEEDSSLSLSEIATILTESATQGKLTGSLYGTPNRILFSPHLWADTDGTEEVYEEDYYTFSMSDEIGGNGSYSFAWYYKTGGGEYGLVSSSSSYTRLVQEDDPDFDVRGVLTSAGLTYIRDFSVQLCWNHGEMQCEAEN